MEVDSTRTEPRSRRAILAGAIGGAAAAVVAAAGGPARSLAAHLPGFGHANNAGTANTSLTTSSAGTALLVTQNGSGTALRGSAVGAGSIAGFFTAQNGTGISGVTGNSGSYGVFAENNGALGAAGALRANGNQNHGIVASTDNNARYAVRAIANGTAIYATASRGIRGESPATSQGVGVAGVAHGEGFAGAFGDSPSAGVHGTNNHATGGLSAGVWGESFGPMGVAVRARHFGTTGDSTGLMATTAAASGFAAKFVGKVDVAGALSKSSGSFRIDHPLAPTTKWLYHSFVESPDMLNVYSGVATLDANGEATIRLPAYFDALNRDVRYQLTAIGGAAPDLHVKAMAEGNRFAIGGGNPGQEVSWQVTGIRKDAWAEAHRIEVEVKAGADRGKYQHPLEHGRPASEGAHYEMTGRAAIDQHGRAEVVAALRGQPPG